VERNPLSVGTLRTLREGIHRLFDLLLMRPAQDGGIIFSILTAPSRPFLFCSSVARFLQGAGCIVPAPADGVPQDVPDGFIAPLQGLGFLKALLATPEEEAAAGE
jgi:hypothetical protein